MRTSPAVVRRGVIAVAASAALLVPVLPSGASGSAGAAAGGSASSCRARTLVLSAMPVELGPLLAQEKVTATVTAAGRDYFVGRLRGHDVVLTLTGIGPVNARRSTVAALKLFRCGRRTAINAVVFSGVAGGDYIGDVTVPARWTLDAGKHFLGVDSGMYDVARRLAHEHVRLEQKAPAGDPACGCVTSPDAVTTVAVTHVPRIEAGGDGQTTDPFAGRALPCAPGGGDVFGCEPCAAQTSATDDAQHFAAGVVPFADPAFFTGYFAASSSESSHYVAEDEETAMVDEVATAHLLPFLGFRAVSDGGGDPLHLPGFPVEFFVYRQLAADNAATATMAFLAAWPGS
jgi:nucleoside phosphorylase